MAIIQCTNGHHYDDSKYKECPYCKITGEYVMDYEKTVGCGDMSFYEYDKTIAFDIENGMVDDDEKTVGAYSFEKGTQFVTGWLVCTKGPARGRDYKIYHGWNRIGRNMDMNVYIPDDVDISSDCHAAIVFDDKKGCFFIVNDSGALTYLNGERIADSAGLSSGDKINMGSSEFIFIAFCTEERRWEE